LLNCNRHRNGEPGQVEGLSQSHKRSGSLARCGACLSDIGVLVPVMAPHDGVPDGTVQAILVLPARLPDIASPRAPGLWWRFPQLAGADPAVIVVRQEQVLVVHKEKDGA
jgi:hypothetical protein